MTPRLHTIIFLYITSQQISSKRTIELAKKFIWVFHKMLWENPHKRFGPPNISSWVNFGSLLRP